MKTPLKGFTGKRISLYVALLLGVMVLMLSLRTCSVPRSVAYSGDRKSGGDTIDVAIEYSPMSVYTYGDTLGGFNFDLMNHVAAQAGYAVKYHPVVSLEKSVAGLEDGMYDILIADVPMTLDFQDRFVYSDPVYLDKQVLVQRKDSLGRVEIVSQLDLAQREVWVVANSPVVSRLKNLSAEIGDTIYVKQDNHYGAEQLLIMTAVGDIPRAVVNEKSARAIADDYPDVDISTAISFTQFQSWIMRKDNVELADSINAVLKRIKQTGFYKALESKYLQ